MSKMKKYSEEKIQHLIKGSEEKIQEYRTIYTPDNYRTCTPYSLWILTPYYMSAMPKPLERVSGNEEDLKTVTNI